MNAVARLAYSLPPFTPRIRMPPIRAEPAYARRFARKPSITDEQRPVEFRASCSSACISRRAASHRSAARAAQPAHPPMVQGRHRRPSRSTGARSGDGSSTIAANLAIVLAQLGERTLLIDANFRNPQQQELFALRPEAGLDRSAARARTSTMSRSRLCRLLSICACSARAPFPGIRRSC